MRRHGFKRLICNGFSQVCPPMVNDYFIPMVNFAPHLIRQLTPNPSFDHCIFEACDFFWLKKMAFLAFFGVVFSQAGEVTSWELRTKTIVAASDGMFETSGWFTDENRTDHWFPLMRPYYRALFLGGSAIQR